MTSWYRYIGDDGPVVGVGADEGMLRPVWFGGVPLTDMRTVVDGTLADQDVQLFDQRDIDSLQLLDPLGHFPRNIFCVGKNYHEHAVEFGSSGYDSSTTSNNDMVPDHPIVFSKSFTSVIGPGATIEAHPDVTSEVDYEAELAVVIGKGGRGIAAADALDHVFGYTIVNDVTARDLQRQHKQWLLGKGLDTFCPMGPAVVTADSFDLAGAVISCSVNGEPRQKAPISDLIFDIPTLIETISAGTTLLPGDVIATGTPAGVGIGFDPPRFLTSGDEVAITLTDVGTLTNRLG